LKKKIILAIAALLIAVLLLAACSSSSDYYPNADYYISTEYTETGVEIYETVPIPQIQTWHEAYAALLRQYYRATAHLPAEEGWLFAFHDINGNGVPELIIWDSYFGSFFFTVHAAYTFAEEEVRQLEITEDFGGHPATISLFSPPGNTPGIIVNGAGEGFWRRMLINMEGYSLVIEVCATLSTSPWDRGYDDLLYFIRGLEVTAAELPDHLYWLADEEEGMSCRGYVLVTEEEFFRVLDAVFGLMPENEGTRPRPIA